MYPIILFDLDDTLVDFSAAEALSLKKIHYQFYQEIAYSLFECCYKEINLALWKQVGAQENPLMPRDVRFLRFHYLNEQIGCSTPAQEVAEQYDSYLGEFSDWLPQVNKSIEFLHKKGHILGVITNGLSDTQGSKRKRLGLHQWFDCFVVSDEVGIAKPNKDIFEIALQELTRKRNSEHFYNKNSMLMVGDSLISDGYGALNFGIHYCHINRHSEPVSAQEEIFKYHLQSVVQLPACLGYEAEYELFLREEVAF